MKVLNALALIGLITVCRVTWKAAEAVEKMTKKETRSYVHAKKGS